MAVSLRDRESGGRRPLCVLHRVLQEFLQHRRFPGERVSEQVVQASWNVAASASAIASLACVPTWHEDFRENLAVSMCPRW